MLLLSNTAPGLLPSDFTRILPSSLSSWQTGLASIHPQRDRLTFSPTGRYILAFYSREAITLFKDRIRRLQSLAAIRNGSKTGFWENDIPTHLRSAEDPADELNSFTIATNLDTLEMRDTTASAANAWEDDLVDLVKDDGFGERPAMVLLEVSPRVEDEMEALAEAVAHNRGGRDRAWQVSKLHDLGELIETRIEESGRPKTWEREPSGSTRAIPSRYVVSAVDEAEARRFQRYWNARYFTGRWGRRYNIHTECLSW